MELAEWRHLPVWAALTDGQLAKFDPPPICRKLHIFCDNDKKFCGLYSGVGLGYHLGIKRPGIDVEIHYPTGVKDYNDLLRARKSESNVVSLDEARRKPPPPSEDIA
jgi:hypothetical protein